MGRKSAGLNFETIISLKPDLVILYAQMDGPGVGRRLKAMGIQAITIIPESFDTIAQALMLMAKATGCEERANQVNREMDKIRQLLNTRLGTIPEEKKRSGYFASTLGFFSTTTANMIQHEIMTHAGVTNVSAQLSGYFQDISPEQLIRWNPDLILASRFLPQSQTRYLKNKALQRISAIQSNQVYRCPSSLAPWDFPSPLSILAALWLADKAYPEKFEDLNYQAIVENYHRLLFGMGLEEMGGRIADELEIQ